MRSKKIRGKWLHAQLAFAYHLAPIACVLSPARSGCRAISVHSRATYLNAKSIPKTLTQVHQFFHCNKTNMTLKGSLLLCHRMKENERRRFSRTFKVRYVKQREETYGGRVRNLDFIPLAFLQAQHSVLTAAAIH